MSTEVIVVATENCGRRLVPAYFTLTSTDWTVGAQTSSWYRIGIGAYFASVNVPQGSIIDSAFLRIYGAFASAGTPKSRISAEDVNSAVTIANDGDVFDTRWGARTTARVDWDGGSHTDSCGLATSPDIKTVIKEIVDRPGWSANNNILIFLDDFEDRSTHGDNRYRPALIGHPSCTVPTLVINWSPSGWSGKVSGVSDPAKVLGVAKADIGKVMGVS